MASGRLPTASQGTIGHTDAAEHRNITINISPLMFFLYTHPKLYIYITFIFLSKFFSFRFLFIQSVSGHGMKKISLFSCC